MNESDLLELSRPDPFQDQDKIHAIFTELRQNNPVAWCPIAPDVAENGRGYWSVTKYDDIVTVSKNPEVFSSNVSDEGRGGIVMMDPLEYEQRGESLETNNSQFSNRGKSMITMDPPQHNQHRKMVAPGFTPQKLSDMENGVRARVTEILDKLEGQEEFEFVSAVAAELPIQVLAELFNVPQEDRYKLFEWSNIIIGGDDPDIRVSQDHVMKSYMDMAMYAMSLRTNREQEEPGRDLISMLAHSHYDGETMSVENYLSAFVLLVVAGNETTRNSISGGLLALSKFPEQRERLLADRSLIPNAVDEIIRWVAPVAYMRRTALVDTELHGQPIKQGDKLVMWYMSANRDEEKFDRPFEFDVTRTGPRHLSFGFGQHLCIGWRLAEIQLRILLEEMLERYPTMTATGEIERLRSNFLNSIKRMPVKLAA
ncbi:MAG: cytochrome P450 [Pseudomonadota bacterium]